MDPIENLDLDNPYYWACGICELYGEEPHRHYKDEASARAAANEHEDAHPYPATVFVFDVPNDFSGFDIQPVRVHLAETQAAQISRFLHGEPRLDEESVLERLGFFRPDS